jgi:UPF0755 protein
MPGFSVFRFAVRTLVALAVVAGVAAAIGWWWLGRPLALPSTPYALEVRPGATLASVARKLAGDGVIPHPAMLTLLARAKGVDRTIKAGQYEFEPPLELVALLARLTQGDVTQTSITFVEGTTAAELLRRVAAEPTLASTLAGRPGTDPGRARDRRAVARGQFFPDTYFYAAAAGTAHAARAHRQLAGRLDAAWARRAPGLPLASPYGR